MDNQEVLVRIFDSKIQGMLGNLDNLGIIDADFCVIMPGSKDKYTIRPDRFTLQSVIEEENITIEYIYNDSEALPASLKLTIERPFKLSFQVPVTMASRELELVERLSPKLSMKASMKYRKFLSL